MWERRNEIDFPTNLEYMMNNIDRFAEENFLPTNTDVLYARQRTTGVVETGFAVRFCRASLLAFTWALLPMSKYAFLLLGCINLQFPLFHAFFMPSYSTEVSLGR